MPLSEHRKRSYSPPPRWDSGSINKKLMGSSSGEHFRCNVATRLVLSVYPIFSSSYTHARGYLDLLKWVFGLIDAPIVFETRGESSHTAVSKFYLDSGSLRLSRPKWWSSRWNLLFVPLNHVLMDPWLWQGVCALQQQPPHLVQVYGKLLHGGLVFCQACFQAIALWCIHSVVVWTSDF